MQLPEARNYNFSAVDSGDGARSGTLRPRALEPVVMLIQSS